MGRPWAVGGSVSNDSFTPIAETTLQQGIGRRRAFKGEHTVKAGREWARLSLALAAGVVCFVFALSGSAQVRTQTTTTTGKATERVEVDRAEVVLVSGNDLLLRMEDGTIRHIANVPETLQGRRRWQGNRHLRSKGRHDT